MMPSFAPRALIRQPLIAVSLYPVELHHVIDRLETELMQAIEDPRQEGYAHWLCHRIAELRETGR
jgi:hypothetical protein